MTIEVMKQALEALEKIADEVLSPYDNELGDAILALRAAIEQAPRQWQGLTDEEFQAIAIKYALPTPTGLMYFKDEIEAKLKEKNT